MEKTFLEEDWSLEQESVGENEIAIEGISEANEKNNDDFTFSTGLEENENSQQNLELNPFDGLPFSSNYFKLFKKRQKLPVWAAKNDFVLAIEESSVVLVSGKAGSGKSTQIPQWCARLAKESNFKFGTVICSQPYFLATESLSIQVAREMDFTSVGNEVGFETISTKAFNQETILKFCTDEILLREMTDDPFLQKYNYVIVDEFQERTTFTDLILALLRIVVSQREDLRIVIISLDHEMSKLEEFFEEVPIVDLYFLELSSSSDIKNYDEADFCEVDSANKQEKKRHESEIEKIEQTVIQSSTQDYCRAVVNLVSNLHCSNNEEGNFLVYLPCPKDVYEVADHISRELAIRILREENAKEFRISQIHHQLPAGAQQSIYEQEANNQNVSDDNYEYNSSSEMRHIIISDEITESCFSLDNISVVIDTDHTYINHFNSRFRTHHETFRKISYTSSKLRLSRCKPDGNYFKLNFVDLKDEMQPPRNLPKITTSELSEAILLMKRVLFKLNVPYSQCQLLDPPNPEAYMLALEELDYHGALDENGGLSDLGIVMSEIPLPISQAKTIISSCGEDCTEEITTIMAMLNSPSCFNESDDAHVKFCHTSGDHFTLLNTYNQYIKNNQSDMWCSRNGLIPRSLKAAHKKRQEMLSMMESLELPISKPVEDQKVMETSVKKALLAGYFMQIARDMDECGNYHIIRDKHTARIHPDSKIKSYPKWMIYNQFHLSVNNFLSCVCSITPTMIAEIVPASYLMNLPVSESQEILQKKLKKLKQQPSASTDVVPADTDDTDVITQAMRDLTYAYNSSQNFIRQNSEYINNEAQCVIQ